VKNGHVNGTLECYEANVRPWKNGYTERFKGTVRHEVLNTEWFATTRQAQATINQWFRQYNHMRPHHAPGLRPPVPETLLQNPQITGPDQGGYTQDRRDLEQAVGKLKRL
jgi:hypothetical protein